MGYRQKTISGLVWQSFSVIGNGGINFLVTIILARILTPHDFGLIELLVIFVSVSNVIVDSGFSQAIIRDSNPTNKDLSSVFYFNLLVALVIYATLFISAPFIADYYNAPELTIISRVTFLVVIFNSLSLIQNSLLNRELDFKSVSKANVYGVFISGLCSITMAFTGFGVWAIVANMVLFPLFKSLFFWTFSRWAPTIEFSIKSIKKYFTFSVFLMIQGLLDAIVSNIVSLFIGKAYTKTDLGYFSQGKKMDSYILAPFSQIINKVTYPVLSKIKDENERLKVAYRQIVRIVMFAIIPLMSFVTITSTNFMFFLFGEKWIQSGIYLQLFAIGGIFMPLQQVFVNVVLIQAKSKQILFMAIIKQSIRLLFVILLIKKGVFWIAVGFVLSGVLGSILYISIGMKGINYTLRELLKDLHQTITTTLVSIVMVYFVGVFMKEINTYALFSVQLLVMLVSYILTNKIITNKTLSELYMVVKDIKNK